MRFFLIFIISISLFASCTQTPPTTPLTREDYLRAGKWVLFSSTKHIHIWSGADTTKDVFSYMPTCLQDDTLVFSTAHMGTRYYGATRCSGGDPDHVSFSWGLSNNGNNIYIYNNVHDLFFPTDPSPFNNVDNIITDSASVNGMFTYFSADHFIMAYQIYGHDVTYPHYTDTITYVNTYTKY